MSYDIRFGVKVAGAKDDVYAVIGHPEYDSPTYNNRDIFVRCLDWDYHQGDWYKLADVMPKIERGIRELKFNKDAYKELEPKNGWGTISSAVECLESMRDCIYRTAEEIPIEHLWVRW